MESYPVCKARGDHMIMEIEFPKFAKVIGRQRRYATVKTVHKNMSYV